METLKLLSDSSYPLQNMQALYSNCSKIIKALLEQYGSSEIHVVGIGTSGTVIVSALSMINHIRKYQSANSINMLPVILQKPGIKSSSSPVSFKPNVPLIILDDDLLTGRTLGSIVYAITDHGRVRNRPILDNVECVAIPCVERMLNFEEQRAMIKHHFPSCKLWIH